MQYNPPAYYRPYRDDDEDEDDDANSATSATTGTTDTSSEEEEDARYAIIKAAGPSFKTLSSQMDYERGSAAAGAAYEAAPASTFSNSILYLNPTRKTQTSLFSIKSTNRDQSVYPTASHFSLKLPRVYKNVSQVQCVQISFPFYQNAVANPSTLQSTLLWYLAKTIAPSTLSTCLACLNSITATTSLQFHELGRTNPVSGKPLLHVAQVRDGGYNRNSLVAELNQHTNRTPPFNLITYAEHHATFRTTRTYEHLFNEPGLFLHNRHTNTYQQNPTKGDIIKEYIPDTHRLHSSTPTEQEIYVAYYYPVLKEAVQSNVDSQFLDYGTTPDDTVFKRVVQHFEGVDSTFYYDLCSTNHYYLDKLRRQHTFEYHPIHKYEWYYNPGLNRVGVRFNQLHPSLYADVKKTEANCFAESLDAAGLTASQFATLQTNAAKNGAVVSDLYHVLNEGLAAGTGIPYALYSTPTLASPTSIVYAQDPALLTPAQLTSTTSHLLDLAHGTLTAPVPGPYVPPGTPYNFGYWTLQDIDTRTADTANYGNPVLYDATFASGLSTLNGKSVLNRRVGGGRVPGYSGVALTTTDFTTLYSTYVSYASTYIGQTSTISSIVGCSMAGLSNYTNTKYSTVLPPQLLANNGYLNNATVGVEFYPAQRVNTVSSPFETLSSEENSCCNLINNWLRNYYYSCLPVDYIGNTLAYKLGFIGPIYTNISTFAAYLTFLGSFNVLPTQNTYLQINTEQSFNNMDVAGDENYTVSNETTGQTKYVIGKILTIGQDFLGVSQTVIQNPARFVPPLGKLDKLEFTLLLDDLTPLAQFFPFGFDFTNWDAVFQIDEEVASIDRENQLTTVPTIGISPGKLPF